MKEPDMTLRDYFAALAMQAFVSQSRSIDDYLLVPVAAYRIADAMLHARHGDGEAVKEQICRIFG